jgi:hypothetical protein
MGTALGKYLLANKGELPGDVLELKPYFDSQTDDTMLQRYRMLRAGNVKGFSPTESFIAEKEPIQDGQFDAVFKVGVSAYSFKRVNELGESGSRSIFYSKQLQSQLRSLFERAE